MQLFATFVFSLALSFCSVRCFVFPNEENAKCKESNPPAFVTLALKREWPGHQTIEALSWKASPGRGVAFCWVFAEKDNILSRDCISLFDPFSSTTPGVFVFSRKPGGTVYSPYNGLYREGPPERGTFFKLQYTTYEDCVKEAYAVGSLCRASNVSQLTTNINEICDGYQDKLKRLCSAHCAKASCLECFNKMERIVENCELFSKLINCDLNASTAVQQCQDTKISVIKYCNNKECQVCKDLFCRNGGKCAGPKASWCACPSGYAGAFCQKSKCAKKPCQNGGTCIGENLCKCPLPYSGAQCTRRRLGTKENPAPNAQAILDAGDSVGSGMYWIQPPGESAPAKTFCDMSFANGGWMLASYGYVHTTGINANNKGIPNMNNPFGYAWLPTQRSSSNGVINLPHGAVKLANNARYMIMAAGNNPATGGVDEYAYVYRIDLRNNPYNITFANHNRYNGGQPGRMHVVDFVVEALKGESGTYVRYSLGEALGVTWTDSYPTGYGFNDKTAPNAIFSKGPFFPSVHSGSGRGPCSGCTPTTNYPPDVVGGTPQYTHHGWFSATGWGKTGQTSIWFK